MPGIMVGTDQKDSCVDEEAHVLTMKYPIDHADNDSCMYKAEVSSKDALDAVLPSIVGGCNMPGIMVGMDQKTTIPLGCPIFGNVHADTVYRWKLDGLGSGGGKPKKISEAVAEKLIVLTGSIATAPPQDDEMRSRRLLNRANGILALATCPLRGLVGLLLAVVTSHVPVLLAVVAHALELLGARTFALASAAVLPSPCRHHLRVDRPAAVAFALRYPRVPGGEVLFKLVGVSLPPCR